MSTRKLDITRKSGKAESLSLKFSQRIIGQPKGTAALTNALEIFESGFYNRDKPIYSMLALGPTGVGKTGSVDAFCEGLFGDAKKKLKVSCGEFQHSHEIAKLVGSPPGYLGHRETKPYFTNQSLLEARSEKSGALILPFTVVLWDEIEKASDALWALMLGILDKGELTTGTNEPVDFKPTIHIMTSNVGAGELATLAGDAGLGFQPAGKEISQQEMEDVALSAARRKFMPEFLNRINKIVVYNTLQPEDVKQILSLELQKLQDRVTLRSNQLFTINVSPSAFRQLLKEGYNKKDNARYLQRTVEQYVSEPISSLLATGQILPRDTVIVDYVDGENWSYYAQGAGDILFP